MKKQEIKERINETLNNWKEAIGSLSERKKLDVAESSRQLEILKKRLNEWLDKSNEEFEKLSEKSKAELTGLRQQLDELRVQAALARAEGRDALEEQEKKIRQAIADIEVELKKLMKSSDEAVRNMAEKSAHSLALLQMKLELLRLQAHLAAMEARSEWEKNEKVLKRELAEWKIKMKKWEENAGERYEEFSKEMSEAWKHLKRAVGFKS